MRGQKIEEQPVLVLVNPLPRCYHEPTSSEEKRTPRFCVVFRERRVNTDHRGVLHAGPDRYWTNPRPSWTACGTAKKPFSRRDNELIGRRKCVVMWVPIAPSRGAYAETAAVRALAWRAGYAVGWGPRCLGACARPSAVVAMIVLRLARPWWDAAGWLRCSPVAAVARVACRPFLSLAQQTHGPPPPGTVALRRLIPAKMRDGARGGRGRWKIKVEVAEGSLGATKQESYGAKSC